MPMVDYAITYQCFETCGPSLRFDPAQVKALKKLLTDTFKLKVEMCQMRGDGELIVVECNKDLPKPFTDFLVASGFDIE